MDDITRQNQFYEPQVIKQENEAEYERHALDVEPQQQSCRPGGSRVSLTASDGHSVCLGACPLPGAWHASPSFTLGVGFCFVSFFEGTTFKPTKCWEMLGFFVSIFCQEYQYPGCFRPGGQEVWCCVGLENNIVELL